MLLSLLIIFDCIVVFLRVCCMILYFCMSCACSMASSVVFSSVFNIFLLRFHGTVSFWWCDVLPVPQNAFYVFVCVLCIISCFGWGTFTYMYVDF